MHFVFFKLAGHHDSHHGDHHLPLVKQAQDLTAGLIERLTCPVGKQQTFLRDTKAPGLRLGERAISIWAKAAGAKIPDFQAKRIRSGVETMLASARISRDIRGRLQSHGISGVQARHYDGHDYMDEKREVLETLFSLLEGLPVKSGKVAMLKAA